MIPFLIKEITLAKKKKKKYKENRHCTPSYNSYCYEVQAAQIHNIALEIFGNSYYIDYKSLTDS